jgi:protein-S-isoprenylcysteine O-methyltransferase Ste14
MSDSIKGWIFVTVQFVLIICTALSAAFEFKYLDRPLYPVIHYIGVTIILLGAVLFSLIVINFGQIMTPNPVPRAAAVLKTNGLYRIVRHPMYFTVLVLMLGVILYFQAFFSLLWLPVLFGFFVLKTKMEEKFLSKKYVDYTEYSSRTKRIIPYLY